MVTDLWLAREGIAAGHALVVDMEGSTLAHLAKVNLMAMKKFMYYIQVNNWFCSQQQQKKNRNFKHFHLIFFLSCILGSFASSTEGIAFHQCRFIYGQTFGNDASIYEKRTYGYDSCASNDGYIFG